MTSEGIPATAASSATVEFTVTTAWHAASKGASGVADETTWTRAMAGNGGVVGGLALCRMRLDDEPRAAHGPDGGDERREDRRVLAFPWS